MEAPQEELFLIEGPEHAISLLGFSSSEQLKLNKKELVKLKDKFPPTSLLNFYLGADSSKSIRQHSHTDEIIAFGKKCYEQLIAATDRETKIRNTFLFLTWLAEIEKTTATYDKALQLFVALNFKTENTGNLHDMCNTLRDRLNIQLPPQKKISFMRTPPKEKKGAAGFKHKVSVRANLKKPHFHQISQHVFLGKIPVFAFEGRVREICKPSVIISAVNNEFHTAMNKKSEHQPSKPSLWIQHNIRQLFLDKFIDFQEACRNNPAYSKELLDAVYTDIYYTIACMDDVIKAGGIAYVHCKAGKGRSPQYLVEYYLFHPEELPNPEQLLNIIEFNKEINGEKKMTEAERAAFLTDWTTEKLEQFRADWKTMTEAGHNVENSSEGQRALHECIKYIHQVIIASRTHIDPIEKIANAAFDCYCFIKQNEAQLSKKTYIQHFFPEPAQNGSGKTPELQRIPSLQDL